MCTYVYIFAKTISTLICLHVQVCVELCVELGVELHVDLRVELHVEPPPCPALTTPATPKPNQAKPSQSIRIIEI